MGRNLWRHRQLTWDLARRELHQTFRATALGWFWVVATPLLLLAIYTFAFGVVFRAEPRILPPEAGIGGYALELFCALLAFTMLTEVLNRSPSIVVGNRNYVKKVVFPLEVLIPATMLHSMARTVVGYVVWFVVWVALVQEPPRLTSLWLPVMLLPLVLMACGVGWILASLGVFIRDMQNTTALVTRMLFFLTPIFYTKDRLPAEYQDLLYLNPLTLVIENIRRVLIAGDSPLWAQWGIAMAIGAVLSMAGYAFFMKSKRAFADVI